MAVYLALLVFVSAAQAQYTQLPNPTFPGSEATGFPPCDALISAGLGDRVIRPTSDEYEPRVQTWWSANGRYRPWCFFLPQTTEEVANGVSALRESGSGAGDWHIAVRSGGHSFPGCNNIANGVTIDLQMMNSSSYSPDRNLASLQPGASWGQTFSDLLYGYNVTVTGGRDGGVGVGGFLVGGGISYYTGRNGFACDTVVNYEVVLANGTIVEANINENPSLFRALKGGGLNFGIVTRFDLLAMPAVDLAMGSSVFLSNYSDAVVDALVEFTDSQEQFRDDALFTLYSHNASASDVTTILTAAVNTQANLNSPSFDRLKQIPSIAATWERTSYALAANNSQIEAGLKNVGSTITFLNNPSVLRQSALLHDELVSTLSEAIGAENFVSFWIHQPIPSYLSSIGQQNQGGVRNMLGLENLAGNAIMWTGGVGITNGDDAATAIAGVALNDAARRLREVSITEGAEADFVYWNYAGPEQDPLGSYGAENVAFLRDVAVQYDPQGFWQQRVPGGFKISRVAMEEA